MSKIPIEIPNLSQFLLIFWHSYFSTAIEITLRRPRQSAQALHVEGFSARGVVLQGLLDVLNQPNLTNSGGSPVNPPASLPGTNTATKGELVDEGDQDIGSTGIKFQRRVTTRPTSG